MEEIPLSLAYSVMDINTGGQAYYWAADKDFSAAGAMRAYSKPEGITTDVDYSAEEELLQENIALVLREIEENYSEELNITALAAEHFVSQQHLIRLFRTATGYTPYEYLKKHRLKKSIDLLTYSDASVETISGMVGFSGVSNYIYQFRNEYGITPSKYRKYFY